MREELIRKINEILDTVTDIWILEQIYKFCIGMTKQEKEAQHNGKEKRKRELCNRDYLHGEKKIVVVPDHISCITGREYGNGSSVDFQVRASKRSGGG